MMRVPNFFIIGAPKCGTTALSEYLRAHPQVFMSTPKEPHYFAEDFPRYRYVDTWEDYLQMFRGVRPEQIAVGEASVYYLYSSVAVPRLLDRAPHAKLIVMLRNSLELAPSMHATALYTRAETEQSFADAWRLCDTRRGGDGVPSGCADVKVILYDQLARLGEQMQRLLQHVPRAQVKWFFLEDLAADPRGVYREALSFIGVDDDGRDDFPQVNGRKRHRLESLGQFIEQPPAWLPVAANAAKRALFLRRLGVLDMLRRINTVSARSPPLDATLEREMREWFAPDIRLLEGITGRDLSHWVGREAYVQSQ